MSDRRTFVNPGGGAPAADLAGARELLARLRAALAGKQHWVIATDDAPTADVLRALAAVLVLKGATAAEVVYAEPDIVVARRGLRFPFAALAVAKSALPAGEAAALVAHLTGRPLPGLAAAVRDGRDVFPIGHEPGTVAGCLDQVLKGRCHVPDVASN